MTSPFQIDQLAEQVGLVARHEPTHDLSRFAQYREDPNGFLERIGADPFPAQRTLAELVRDHPRVVCRSANGCGKGWLAARLLLWWTIARGGLAIVTAPTMRQVKNVMMRELRAAFSLCDELPGELYEESLRVDVARQIGVLAYTSNEASRWQGIHHPELLVLIDEAQGCESAVFQAADACQPLRTLAIGNPLSAAGDFYRISQQSELWRSFKIAASDVPNVATGRVVIPGAITTEWCDSMRAQYGVGSFVTARVDGEFPLDSIEGLYNREQVRRAFARHESGELADAVAEQRLILSIDPARYGSDATACAFVRGNARACVVERIVTWNGASLTETADRVIALAEAATVTAVSRADFEHLLGRPRLIVDEPGLGSGLVDILRARGWAVSAYNGAHKPLDESRFLNTRASTHWRVRELLEAGRLALPRSAELEEEAAAIEWQLVPNGGKVQILSKDTVRERIGRSPDRWDSIVMGVSLATGAVGYGAVTHEVYQ